MLLREKLNEFELDWAQAAVRSKQIPESALKGARVLLVGGQHELQEAIAWSFMAWNDVKKAGIRVAEAELVSVRKGGADYKKPGKKGTGKNRKIIEFRSAKADRGEAENGSREDAEYRAAGSKADANEGSGAGTAAGISADGANLASGGGKYQSLHLEITCTFTGESFAVQEADYVIVTGLCQQAVPAAALMRLDYLQKFQRLTEEVSRIPCKRLLLLSDGRVYGALSHAFEVSEYEAGQTDPASPAFGAQYLMQAMESVLVAAMRGAGRAYDILRTGLLYGACIPMLPHAALQLAQKTAKAEPFILQSAKKAVFAENASQKSSQEAASEGIASQKKKQEAVFAGNTAQQSVPREGSAEASSRQSLREEVSEESVTLRLSPERSSYLCMHDLLTAIQFVLTRCPENKIFNVKGPQSDKSAAELAILLYQNFPEQCKMMLQSGEDTDARRKITENGGLLLNTQLLEHYGFLPQISMEDGLIILVKSLQNTGEVFIFDNTYLGKLTRVQEILLGYLLEIDRICKKYDIQYFLAGGTLLGAIRHHGFIPWDDDADVMMLREDYDRFLEVAPRELPDHIFLQLPTTEKGNYNPFTKLRIDNTMFATQFTGKFMDMHNGIFFDILAHDKTGNRKWSQKLHLMVTMLTRSVVFNKWGDTDIKSGGKHPWICKFVDRAKYLVPMPLALWAQNHALQFFKNRPSSYLYDGMGRNLKRGAFPKKWLDEAIYVDFEGYQFPVPREYDKYLTYLYGDYMQMIPVSSRRTSHSIVLTDLGAYTDFQLGGKKVREQEESQP